jgi:serine/threonine-protein kinase
MPAHRHDFGKYKLLRRIAAGGMGEVHLAKLVGPSGFEKLVVIKRLLQSRQTEQKYVDMFFAEARVAAQLGHSNIVQVYEVGTIENVPYIAMEYVHGKSLRKVLDRALKRPTTLSQGGVPPGFTAYIISQLCMGLAFAHDARHLSGATIGLVHRDINPHNVLISYQGEVKIIDFGIAKSELNLDQTQAGTIKGTVVYMSPEQSLGEKLDKRSDLFSVGICLYEALTGKNPFHKSGMGASLEAIRQAEYPPVDLERKELAPFGPVLAHTLAKHRADRYPDCAQLADALMQLVEAGQVPRPTVPLANYMAELFGQEMLEEEQLLERTDMVRNPLLSSGVMPGTQPVMRPTLRQTVADDTAAPKEANEESGYGATLADLPLMPEATAMAAYAPAVASAQPVAAPVPMEASQSYTPSPLAALVRPLWPSGQKLMQWAHALGSGPTLRRFWPYFASFFMVFSVMGTIALVTGQPKTTPSTPAEDAAPAAAASPPAPTAAEPTAAPSAPPTVLATAEPDDDDDALMLDTHADSDKAEPPVEARRAGRRRARARAAAKEEHLKNEGALATVQIKAEPPLAVQYGNAVVDEAGARLSTISGTLRVGQNPDSDAFLITINYRLTPRGISYQIDSTPWADVTGPGGVMLGRTPLRWTEPSSLLSLEFQNPHSPVSQRLTLRMVH